MPRNQLYLVTSLENASNEFEGARHRNAYYFYSFKNYANRKASMVVLV